MQIIEHAQKIESRSIDDLLKEAENRKEKGLDIYYAFLAGLLKTAYERIRSRT